MSNVFVPVLGLRAVGALLSVVDVLAVVIAVAHFSARLALALPLGAAGAGAACVTAGRR